MTDDATAFVRLHLFACEAARSYTQNDSPRTRLTVDLADIRAWRFFKAAPEAFFEQYASDYVIENVHLEPRCAEAALEWLAEHPVSDLALSGRLLREKTQSLLERGRTLDVGVAVHALTAPRLLTLVKSEGTLVLHASSVATQWAQALLGAGAPASAAAHSYWAQIVRGLLTQEVLPDLRIRDKNQFFSYLKALAARTAQGLNWAEIGKECGASAPSVRQWTQYLHAARWITLVPAVRAAAPRRAKLRPKLYWTHPGLALWLTDSSSNPAPEFVTRLYENALFLALRSALPAAGFGHFLDTNNVYAPLIIEQGAHRQAVYPLTCDADRDEALRCLKSLARGGIVEPAARSVTQPADPRTDAPFARLSLISSTKD